MRTCVRLLFAVLATIALAWASSYVYAEPIHPESLVRIYSQDTDGARSFGSGFVLSPTRVVTNYHVIKERRGGDRPVQVRFADGSRGWATVLKESELWDLALLTIHPTTMRPAELGTRPTIGQVVTIQGLGSDYEPIAADGPVTAFGFPSTAVEIPDYFEITDAVARRGDSGGPVTDDAGRVIGILFGSNDGTNPDWPGLYTNGITIDRIRKEFDLPNHEPTDSYILRGTHAESN